VRRSPSKHFTNGFLVVTPGITIKDRLRVLQPNDPDNYYFGRELVPDDMRDDVKKARIVITNYHAFMRRERVASRKAGAPCSRDVSERVRTHSRPKGKCSSASCQTSWG